MGLLTDWLIDRSRANRAKQDNLNEKQAQVYLEAIKSGRLAGNPEALDYANQQVEKLLGTKGKGQKGGAGGPSDSKSLFQRFGQIVHALHGHGQPQQQMGSVGPPPAAGPVEGDEAAPAAKASASPIPPPPSFSSIASQAFPSPATKESEYETQKSFDVGQDIRKEQAKAEADAKAKSDHPAGNQHLQHVDVFDPNKGETVKGSYNPSNGQYLDENGDVIKDAQLAPKSFNYEGPNHESLKGWMVGNRLYDQDMKQLPSGTKVFSAWMQPLTTTTDSYKSEPQPDGTTLLVPIETSSTRTRGGPTPPPSADTPPTPAKSDGAPAAPSKDNRKARVVGGKVPPGVSKSYESYNAAQERWAVMQDALPRALKGDQQAMLNLLANHVGMTMGLQKGARITQGVYSEAEQSAPILQRIAARFDSNGYLSGVVLTPDQMRQMIDLAKVRLQQDKEAWDREVGAAKTGYGMTPPPKATNSIDDEIMNALHP